MKTAPTRIRLGGGGSSTWQGFDQDIRDMTPPDIIKAICDAAAAEKVTAEQTPRAGSPVWIIKNPETNLPLGEDDVWEETAVLIPEGVTVQHLIDDPKYQLGHLKDARQIFIHIMLYSEIDIEFST